jgi:hypothetical protein
MTTEKGGPPKLEIDYKTLSSLCKIQCTGEECAAIIDMDYDTLNRRLKEEGYLGFTDYFKKHSSGGKASLRRKQIAVAMDGNPTMLVWMGKQHLGQTDKAEVDNKSSDGSMSPGKKDFNDFYEEGTE